MRQAEWHKLVRTHALGPLRELWPEVTVHKSWIVAADDQHWCWTVGWEVPSHDGRSVSNYAMVHLDFRSGPPTGQGDLSTVLGGEEGRQAWVQIPDDVDQAGPSMAELVARMRDEAAPFFRRFGSAPAVIELLVPLADQQHPLQLGRLETLAGLSVLEGDTSAALAWYDRLLDAAAPHLAGRAPAWLVSQAEWWRRCRAAVAGQGERIDDLFAARAVEYRKEGGLPPASVRP